MRPEDLTKLFEGAFDKVEPKDDAQREKLERLRAKISQATQDMAAEIAKIKGQCERLARPSSDLEAIHEERSRIARDARTAIASAFSEQTELIRRIANRIN